MLFLAANILTKHDNNINKLKNQSMSDPLTNIYFKNWYISSKQPYFCVLGDNLEYR